MAHGVTWGQMADASAFVWQMQTLTFTVATLQASASDVKYPGGAVSERVQQAGAGMGAPLIQVGGISFKDDSFLRDSEEPGLHQSVVLSHCCMQPTIVLQSAYTPACQSHMSRTLLGS